MCDLAVDNFKIVTDGDWKNIFFNKLYFKKIASDINNTLRISNFHCGKSLFWQIDTTWHITCVGISENSANGSDSKILLPSHINSPW